MTNHFQILGWSLPTFALAAEKAGTVLERLVNESRAVCLEAHFRNIEGVKRLDAVISSDRFACYCWNEFRDSADFGRPEFQKFGQARLVFANTSLLLNLPPLTQAYDWDGRPCGSLNLMLEQEHYPPLKPDDREPSPRIARLFSDLARAVLGQELENPVKTTSIWKEEFRAHQYALVLPMEKAIKVAKEVCVAFDLKNGLGSYEFLGTEAQIEQLQESRQYQFTGFPENCWSLNAPRPAPFALARQAFLWPILNLETSRLHEAAAVLDALGDQVVQRAMVKEYLGWRLNPSEVSPRTQGNYLLISQQKRDYVLFAGFQQYVNNDPSVERFIAAATPILKQLGATLKKVSGPR